MDCKECGAAIEEGVTECAVCGATQDTGAAAPEPKSGRSSLGQILAEAKWIIVLFALWCLITLPCACCVGYRTQWILWKLGLR